MSETSTNGPEPEHDAEEHSAEDGSDQAESPADGGGLAEEAGSGEEAGLAEG